MTKINTNYHTHTYLCKHAVGTVDDYVKRAIDLNYEVIGMSDHCPLIPELKKQIYSRRMDMDEFYNIYLPAVEKAKKDYQGQIEVLGAVEVEYFDEMKDFYPELLSKLDYLVLGQHYIKSDGKFISMYSQLDTDLIEIYCDTVCKALDTGYFKILAHPDCFNWGYPVWDEFSEMISKRIIDAAIRNNVVIELNANGMRNCEKNKRYCLYPQQDSSKEEIHCYAYPNINFFKLVAKTNALVMVNDDAHDPNFIHDKDTIRSYEMAEILGIKLINKLELDK